MNESDVKKLLYVDNSGFETQLREIVYDGLEHREGYVERLPYLVQIVTKNKSVHYQQQACFMLLAWGHPFGFEKLIDWVDDFQNGSLKLNHQTSTHRYFGQSDFFAELANAVDISFDLTVSTEMVYLRRTVIKKLLSIFHLAYFDTHLTMVLWRDKEHLSSYESAINDALVNSLDSLFSTNNQPFLATQIATLLSIFVHIDEANAVKYSSQVLDSCDSQAVRWTLIDVLKKSDLLEAQGLMRQLAVSNDRAGQKAQRTYRG